MFKDPIIVRGAREHNLKNISIDIPSQKLVVITGPSGSGKSSLAFDTIFAEGQRRYIESLSAYARQFMEQMSKPDLDYIDGLSPSVAIEQKTISSHPRSTVGTITNIYDFVRLLYARVGQIRDPETGKTLQAHSSDDILSHVIALSKKNKTQIFASVVRGRKGEFLREFEQWRRQGFSKIKIDGKLFDLHDPILLNKYSHHDIDILLDVLQPGKSDAETRIKDSMGLADKVSEGWLKVVDVGTGEETTFSRKVASPISGKSFPDLEPRIFSFNSPYGMCLVCRGVGFVEKKSNASRRSKREEEENLEDLLQDADNLDVCHACQGARLNSQSLCVFFGEKNIYDLCSLSCTELLSFLESLDKKSSEHPVTKRLLGEITTRLKFLIDVGVGYLSLNRRSATLSGGEAQRIRLATQLGTQLGGVLYVLDEPSIGLHPRDQEKLLKSLKGLRDLGNTVLVVEHDEETMLNADYLIDIGPGAGVHGGQIVAADIPKKFLTRSDSLTARFLSGKSTISTHRHRREGNQKFISVSGCTGHNLKNVELRLPLGKMICFTGVSGSGKSSLVRDTLEAAIAKKLYRSSQEPLPYQTLQGLEHIDKLVHVDQRPIGRSPRSNPATYTGLFSALRAVYAQTPDAQIRGYTPGTFSFNVKGGRCDGCEGAGRVKLEMHFLSDVYVPCETCNGSRYRREVLEVRFKGHSIADILGMSIEEAYSVFENQPLMEPKLRTLMEVGLDYIQLGQSATTLSGGEAQRVKLAKELSKRSTGRTIYFLDEPTTGLHFEDVRKLLDLLQRLTDLGNTVVIIEHQLDVICSSDWIVDIGPSAGSDGGMISFEGTPEQLAAMGNKIPTGKFVHEYFMRRKWPIPTRNS